MNIGSKKINIFFGFILFALIFIAKPVLAVNSIGINNLSAPGQNDTGWVNAMQGFKPQQNNISGFSTWAVSDTINQTMTFDFYICKGTTTQSVLIFNSRSTSTEAQYGCGTTSPEIRIYKQVGAVFTDPNSGVVTAGTTTINFTPIPVEVGQPYYFVMHYTAGNRNLKPSLNYNTYLATSTDVFFYDYWWNGQQRLTDNGSGNTGIDMPFAIWYDVGINESKMTITAPVQGQRVMDNMPLTVSFNVWNPNLAYSGGVIKLLNKTTWTEMNDIWFDLATTSATSTFDINFSAFDKVNYRIYGYLYNANTGQFSVKSNSIDFLVGTDTVFTGSGDQQYTIGGFLTEEQICGTSTATSSFMYAFECSGKKLIYFSLTPNENSINKLKGSWEKFKTQFPFSVYFDLTDTVQDAISSATLNKNDTFDVVMINKTGHIITLPVLSSSSMPRLIGNTNSNLIRDTIGWFIWIFTAFLIFLTFKTL
jgi:hypothetical protein